MNAYDIIIIDEAQFFPDLIESCLYSAETKGKHVIVAGYQELLIEDHLAIYVN